MRWKHFYIFRIEFLGFRFHGWQKQPDQITVQGMIDKTFKFILEDKEFKTLGAGRTDGMVSASDFAFELFTKEPIDTKSFLNVFNYNLPTDIRLKSIETTNAQFNIIQCPKIKTYAYHFSYGPKQHPYSAPFIFCFKEILDIELMKKGALFFKGAHNFRRLTCKPTEKTILTRTIEDARIFEINSKEHPFYPENSFVFEVKASGFLRYQVRMMMAALLELGSGEIKWEEFVSYIENPEGKQIVNIAPKSGLRLEQIEFLNA